MLPSRRRLGAKASGHGEKGFAQTGYGIQTKAMCKLFTELGHQVAVSANFGLHGSTLDWRGVQIYPRYRGGLGEDVIRLHAEHFQADVVLSLYDIWVLKEGFHPGRPWIGMVPVDGAPVSESMIKVGRNIDYRVSYSKFGQRELEKVGLSSTYIPHGFNTDRFTPGDKWAACDRIGVPYEQFLVTVVAANKGYPCRKGWPELLEAFALFWQQHQDTVLYLHTTNLPFGSKGEGMHITAYLDFLGVPKSAYMMISTEDMALGVPEEHLIEFYQASDVFLLPSLGEGFGCPEVEAQACGCPVIVQNASAQAEHCFNGIAIEPLQHMWLPQLGYYWQVPSIPRIVEALEMIYNQEPSEEYWKAKQKEGVEAIRSNYDWQVVRGFWQSFFDNTVEPTLW